MALELLEPLLYPLSGKLVRFDQQEVLGRFYGPTAGRRSLLATYGISGRCLLEYIIGTQSEAGASGPGAGPSVPVLRRARPVLGELKATPPPGLWAKVNLELQPRRQWDEWVWCRTHRRWGGAHLQ
jgi:hypothetical protein